MSDPIFALNIMVMTFDAYYLIRDQYVVGSRDLEEFIKSDPGWVHDDTQKGYTKPRVILIPEDPGMSTFSEDGNSHPEIPLRPYATDLMASIEPDA